MLIGQPDVRLVTLTGPGGVGKTRLALQVAAMLLGDYADGVWFVDLAPLRDPSALLPAIGAVLGITDTGQQPLAAVVAAQLRARRMLLVLDNFEQIAAAAPELAALLSAAPLVNALITSREALRLSGEHEYPVPPLALPDQTRRSTTEQLVACPAVRLFVERARAVRPDLAVAEQEAQAVAGICARLDGLPLAIELAAAHVRLFAPPALLARLAHRLPLLSNGPRDLPDRQRALRATIAWSYELLSPDEQALFQLLAVFAGGFTLAAAEAVCGDGHLAEPGWSHDADPVLRELAAWLRALPSPPAALPPDTIAPLLEALVSKSLVRVVESDGDPRFSMLETIREYALELLATSGHLARVQLRLAGWIAAEMQRAALIGDQLIARHMAGELENIRAALDAAARFGDVLPGLAILRHWEFWQDDASEGLRHIERLLPQARPIGPLYAGVALTRYGLWLFLEQYARARVAADSYFAVTDAYDPAIRAEHADWMYGWCDLGEERLDDARARYARHAERARSRPGEEHLDHLAYLLGACAAVMGDLEVARRHYAESVAGFRGRGNAFHLTYVLVQLAYVEQQLGDCAQAVRHLSESLRLTQELRMRRPLTAIVAGAAGVALTMGELERAAILFGAAEALYERSSGLDAAQRAGQQRNIAALQARLDPATLGRRWQEGRSLSLREAIEMTDLEPAPAHGEAPRRQRFVSNPPGGSTTAHRTFVKHR